ncbi:syntaxin-132-like isoform X1 [Zingiber officinale]|uniref:syntaxin-132-like isoform X1 n=1 Tax=Zingiber officinale TaxID=94328 RepID=UPI001C4B5D9B|nr:syntaxin-132-like isoform X1 [Zingiber officinale]
MNDLLKEDSFRKDSLMESDIELGNQSGKLKSAPDYGMDDFFDQVSEIEKMIDKISNHLHKLQESNEKSKGATRAFAMKEIKQQMEKDVNEVGKIAHKIKHKLQDIDRDNLTNRNKPGCEKGTGVDRSRMALTNALKKKLKDIMNDFQILRQTIQNDYREAVERGVFTVTGTRPTDEVIDHLIETGNSEQIFQKAIQEMGRGQVIGTIEEIQERHDAVKEIEKKLLDLHQVFMDMAVLVEAQGEILDNIESQVSNAMNHVQSGTDALRIAKNLSKKSRKCMIIVIIIFILVAALIAFSILKPWK